MHWADINAAIFKAGWSQTSMAAHLGVSHKMVSQVVRGDKSSYNIASFIAAETGIPLRKLWPDGRYNEAPKRIRSVA